MQVSLPIRITTIILGLISVFWLPWAVTLVCLFLAGLAFPPAAFALGIFADLLYYPGHGIFLGTLWGLILGLIAAAVRHFVKTRIM